MCVQGLDENLFQDQSFILLVVVVVVRDASMASNILGGWVRNQLTT